jgi:hypothetical protein
MKVWLVSVFIIFALVQLVLWLKNFFVPLPLYILGGTCLALASNYEKSFENFVSHHTNDDRNRIVLPPEKNINQ